MMMMMMMMRDLYPGDSKQVLRRQRIYLVTSKDDGWAMNDIGAGYEKTQEREGSHDKEKKKAKGADLNVNETNFVYRWKH